MKADVHMNMHLREGNATTRAVTQTSGAGVNLWIGGVCITADNALLFHEVAKLATLAAQLQESVDEKKTAPHAFSISAAVAEAFRAANIDPRTDSCGLCGKRRDDSIHVGGES